MSLPQEYVLVFAQWDSYRSLKSDGVSDYPVLLFQKNRPVWQKGRYNLPGGKVEAGEDPAVAAARELFEETGLKPSRGTEPELLGKVTGDWKDISNNWGTIYCYRIAVGSLDAKQQEGETEIPIWAQWDKIKSDERLLPNLRIVIPLMIMGLTDWVIVDNGASWEHERHSFSVEVQSTTKNFN